MEKQVKERVGINVWFLIIMTYFVVGLFWHYQGYTKGYKEGYKEAIEFRKDRTKDEVNKVNDLWKIELYRRGVINLNEKGGFTWKEKK